MEPQNDIGKDKGVVHIIDDERDILHVARTALLKSGYQVHSFTDPSQALLDFDICGKKISIVITDIRMPGHNGFEVAREARKIKPNVPIVFMTAFEILPTEFKKNISVTSGD